MSAQRTRPDRRVVLRYAALQLPGQVFVLLLAIAAWEWLGTPLWTTWAVPLAWAAKDALLFPFVWRAYEPDDRTAPAGVGGAIGVVEEALEPRGWVRLGPELWRAELVRGAAPRGTRVRVLAVEGLVLRVEPVDGTQRGAAGDTASTSTRSSSSQSA